MRNDREVHARESLKSKMHHPHGDCCRPIYCTRLEKNHIFNQRCGKKISKLFQLRVDFSVSKHRIMSTVICQQKSQYWPQAFQTLVLFGYIKPNKDPNDGN